MAALSLLVIAPALAMSLTFAPRPAWSLRSARAPLTPTCTAAMLVEWINTAGSAAAGSDFYDLEFTNQSAASCAISGYPAVAAVNLAGHLLGKASSHGALRAPAKVLVHVGESAISVVQIADVSNFQVAKCGPTSAAGFRVTLPGAIASKIVAFPFKACAKPGPAFLFAQAVQTT
jgi:hypothetical protein